MLEQQAMTIQQSQEKQELDRIEKEEQIMKMNISNLDPISTTYFQNRKLELMQKSFSEFRIFSKIIII